VKKGQGIEKVLNQKRKWMPFFEAEVVKLVKKTSL